MEAAVEAGRGGVLFNQGTLSIKKPQTRPQYTEKKSFLFSQTKSVRGKHLPVVVLWQKNKFYCWLGGWRGETHSWCLQGLYALSPSLSCGNRNSRWTQTADMSEFTVIDVKKILNSLQNKWLFYHFWCIYLLWFYFFFIFKTIRCIACKL